MKHCAFFLTLACLPVIAYAQEPVTYQLQYAVPGDCCVQVRIVFPSPLKTPVSLVIPRTYPGGYEQVLYDAFLEDVSARSPQGKALTV